MSKGPPRDQRELAQQLQRANFTPAQRDAPVLAALVVAGDEPAADRAAAALGKLGAAGRHAIDEALVATREAGGRARLVAALGLVARGGDAEARAAVLAAIGDAEVRVRRAAIAALGKLGGDDASAALLARWDAGDAPGEERRTLAEALGRIGGDAALARLRALEPGDDRELARRRDRALLMADRSARRDDVSTIHVDLAPPAPLTVRLHVKPGLGALLVEELAVRGLAGARAVGDDAAELTLDRGWGALYASRLWHSAGVRVPLETVSVEAIVRALTAAPVRALLAAWTRGPIRWRLAFAHGHRRSLVWQVARDVSAAAPELINDPTQTTWEARLDEGDPPALELVPRRAEDPRFAWRVAEVPAASQPSVAAALAFLAGANDGDRVWDPFVGSGGELVERARLGPVAALVGSDVSEAALAAAGKNVAAAGLAALATIVRGDAKEFSPGAAGTVDAIITNPPLGSRVSLDAAALLVAALPNFAKALASGGRLVWITPAPKKTGPVAERCGLRIARSFAVDLGGVRGVVERWEKP